MHTSAFVGVLQCRSGLLNDATGFWYRQPTFLVDQNSEVNAFDVLYHQIVLTIMFPRVESPHDVRMVQAAKDRHLALESCNCCLILEPTSGQKFDRDRSLQFSVDRPVNVVMGLQGAQLSLENLSAIGVKRVSVGSALSRAALGAFLRAAREMHDHGTFTFADEAVSYREISAMFQV